MRHRSLVFGIISLLTAIFSVGALGWLSVILGIIGIVTSCNEKEMENSSGFATAGLVCSIIGICLGLYTFNLCVSCLIYSENV